MTGGTSERKQAWPQCRAACITARTDRQVRQPIDREQTVPLTGRAVAEALTLAQVRDAARVPVPDGLVEGGRRPERCAWMPRHAHATIKLVQETM